MVGGSELNGESSRGGPYHIRPASYTLPDPGAPRLECFQITTFLQLWAKGQGSMRATVFEIDIGTCPAMAGHVLSNASPHLLLGSSPLPA